MISTSLKNDTRPPSSSGFPEVEAVPSPARRDTESVKEQSTMRGGPQHTSDFRNDDKVSELKGEPPRPVKAVASARLMEVAQPPTQRQLCQYGEFDKDSLYSSINEM